MIHLKSTSPIIAFAIAMLHTPRKPTNLFSYVVRRNISGSYAGRKKLYSSGKLMTTKRFACFKINNRRAASSIAIVASRIFIENKYLIV